LVIAAGEPIVPTSPQPFDLGPSSSQGVKLAADALHGASPEAQELGGF